MTSNGNTDTADRPDASGWSASLYNKNASFVYSSAFTAPVLTLLDAQPGEKIIDFGCGSGELTLDLQKIVGVDEGQGMVVGMDISESMVRLLDRARASELLFTHCIHSRLEKRNQVVLNTLSSVISKHFRYQRTFLANQI